VTEIAGVVYYNDDLEWVARCGVETVRVCISHFAQSALGDVVFVQLPDVGAEISAGESFGEVESTKSVSDLYAPVTAKVVAVNGDLESNPQLVNSDPYGEGWLVELQADGESLRAALDALLDAEGYRAHVTE
jgi:glycine cleavage system H protein